jgi:imidazolonepropionase-like amidohydrolase
VTTDATTGVTPGVPSGQPGPLAITGARVLPVDGAPFTGVVLVHGGRIEALGPDVRVPEGAGRLDAAGLVLTPGLIDAHSHLGIDEEASGPAGDDVNERMDPVTPHVRAIDAVNPADLGFADALRGGVLTINVLTGSGNPIGGLGAVLRTAGTVVDDMIIRSPSGLKSALGENPKRVHGGKGRLPSSRLGTAALIREWLTRAAERLDNGGDHERDLKLEALALVLNREIPWRQHCHRADDVATAIRLADEFGYRLVIDHGTEALVVTDRLAERGVPVLTGPLLNARMKVELRSKSIANPARLTAAGVKVALITDHPVVPVQMLQVQAALAVREGMDPAEALRAVTSTPAEVLGVAGSLGTLTPGKAATMCAWTGDPLDVRSRVRWAWIDGVRVVDDGPHPDRLSP